MAGFSDADLDVTLDQNQLTIRGRQQEEAGREYLHRGIAARAFEREALDCGAECIREVAERLQFGADYFGGVFRDLDGHAIEVLTRSA